MSLDWNPRMRWRFAVVAGVLTLVPAGTGWAQDVTTGDAVVGPAGNEIGQADVTVDWDVASPGDPLGGNWFGLTTGGAQRVTGTDPSLGFLTVLATADVNQVRVPNGSVAESLTDGTPTIRVLGGEDYSLVVDGLGLDGVFVEVLGTVNAFGADAAKSAIEFNRATTNTWNVLELSAGGDVVGTVTSIADSQDYFAVDATATSAAAVTSSITGDVSLGANSDYLLLEAVSSSALGQATALINGDVDMGAAVDLFDELDVIAQGKATSQITGNVMFSGGGILYMLADGTSSTTALVTIGGDVTFADTDDLVWLETDAAAGSDGARVHIVGDITLGNGANELYIDGNDLAVGRIAINALADGSGANSSIIGGTGVDLIELFDAPNLFADIDLATNPGGADVVLLSDTKLTGTIAFGTGSSTLTGSNGSQITGAVSTDGTLTLRRGAGSELFVLDSAVNLADGATLIVSDASGITFTGGIDNPAAGGANLTISSGTINTTGTALADTLAVTVNPSGVLQLGAADTFRSISGTGTLNAGGFDTTLTTGTSTFNGTITNGGDLNFTGGTHTFTGNFTFGESVGDAGGMTVDGGVVTLNGTNTITGDVLLNGGTLRTDNTGVGAADIIVQPGATFGAATSSGLTLDASGQLDLSAIDADGEGFTLDVTNGNTIIDDWTLPQADTETFNIASTGTTGAAVLRDLVFDAGGTAETLRVTNGTIRLLDSVTLGAGDSILADATGRIILDAPVPGAGTIGPDAGILFYGPQANLPAYTLDAQHGLATGLDSDHTVTQDVTVNGDTSFIGTGGIDLQGNVDMTGAGRVLTVDPGTTLTITGPILNPGNLTKAGAGNLVLDAALGAGLIANAGQATVNALVTGDVSSNAGSTVILTGDFVGGNLAVTGGTVTASGTDVTINGGLTADTMTVGSSANQLTILGPVTMTTPILTVAGTGVLELGGNITGNLDKRGAGTLIINDTDTDTNAALNNVIVTEGILMGEGPIAGNLSIAAGAQHAPGNSVGAPILVGGNYTLAGTLAIEIDTADPNINDKVVATGDADLQTGSTILVTSASGVRQNDLFTVVEAGATLTVGTITVDSLSNQYFFTGTQVGQTYVLEAFRRPLTRFATNPNQYSIAAAIDQMDDNALTNALGELTASQFADGIRQVNAEPFLVTPQTVAGVVSQINGQVAGQLVARRAGLTRPWLDAGYAGLPALSLQFAQAAQDPWWMTRDAYQPPRIEQTPEQQVMQDYIEDSTFEWGAFAKAFGLFQERDTTDNMLGYSADTYGVTGGLERPLSDNATVGLLFGYSHTDQEFELGRGDATVDSLRVGPYVGLSGDAGFLDASLTLGYHMAEASRQITIGNFSQTADGDYDAWDLAFYVGAGADINLGPVVLTPTAALQFVHYDQQGFEESGGGAANLDVDGWDNQSLTTTLGARFSRLFEVSNGDVLLAPEAFVGWTHEFLDDEEITASFASQGIAFTFSPDGDNRDTFVYGLGMSALFKGRTSLFARYDGNLGSNYLSHGVTGGVAFRF